MRPRGVEQVLLAAEPRVDRFDGNVGVLSDVIDGRRRETPFGEQFARRELSTGHQITRAPQQVRLTVQQRLQLLELRWAKRRAMLPVQRFGLRRREVRQLDDLADVERRLVEVHDQLIRLC